MGELLGIAKHSKARGPMETLSQASVTQEAGVEDDFRGKPGKRQVSVMSVEDWQRSCAELGEALDWTTRRANLLVAGLNLAETAGKKLRIGELELLITRETDPCERMDEARDGLQEILRPGWRGGVCCRVEKAGTICVGDKVELIDAD